MHFRVLCTLRTQISRSINQITTAYPKVLISGGMVKLLKDGQTDGEGEIISVSESNEEGRRLLRIRKVSANHYLPLPLLPNNHSPFNHARVCQSLLPFAFATKQSLSIQPRSRVSIITCLCLCYQTITLYSTTLACIKVESRLLLSIIYLQLLSNIPSLFYSFFTHFTLPRARPTHTAASAASCAASSVAGGSTATTRT
jgi:hypothetical protein